MIHGSFTHDGKSFPCVEGERVTISFQPSGSLEFPREMIVSRDNADLRLWLWDLPEYKDDSVPNIVVFRRQVTDSFKLLLAIAADPQAVAIQE